MSNTSPLRAVFVISSLLLIGAGCSLSNTGAPKNSSVTKVKAEEPGETAPRNGIYCKADEPNTCVSISFSEKSVAGYFNGDEFEDVFELTQKSAREFAFIGIQINTLHWITVIDGSAIEIKTLTSGPDGSTSKPQRWTLKRLQ